MAISVECNGCAHSLDVMSCAIDNNGNIFVAVDPCEHCLDEAADKAYARGKGDGYEEGTTDGDEKR